MYPRELGLRTVNRSHIRYKVEQRCLFPNCKASNKTNNILCQQIASPSSQSLPLPCSRSSAHALSPSSRYAFLDSFRAPAAARLDVRASSARASKMNHYKSLWRFTTCSPRSYAHTSNRSHSRARNPLVLAKFFSPTSTDVVRLPSSTALTRSMGMWTGTFPSWGISVCANCERHAARRCAAERDLHFQDTPLQVIQQKAEARISESASGEARDLGKPGSRRFSPPPNP